jgi:Copper type II ascorbate-dependent monooxygenase, C-terminal domain
MMNKLACIILMVSAVACTKGMATNNGDDDGSNGSNALIPGFNPPPAPAGYRTYVTPPIYKLQPGQDILLCQWIDAASTEDIDIADLQGYQTATGHHVVLYSSAELEPVGTSRECTTDDMVSVQYLGGIGGEGAGTLAQLPDGYVFQHKMGRTLMANVHYLNATDSVQDVQSVLYVKAGAPTGNEKPAGMAVINYLDFQIPPNTDSYTVDAYCTWSTDTSLFMWSNHMHNSGVSVYSEAKQSNGTITPLVTDTTWMAEEAFNPNWTRWDVNSPTVIHKGDQAHISCTWKNTTSSVVAFPDEMCDAVGFYAEAGDELICDAAPKQ